MKTRKKLVLRFNDNGLGSQDNGEDRREPGEMFLCLDVGGCGLSNLYNTKELRETGEMFFQRNRIIGRSHIRPNELLKRKVDPEQDQLKSALLDLLSVLKMMLRAELMLIGAKNGTA